MSSKNDIRSDAPLITRRRHVLACARCRARRVKCDRAQPSCSSCAKVGAWCQPVQNTHSADPSRQGSREPVEKNRLTQLEKEVARLSREVDSRSPSREPSYSPSPLNYSDASPKVGQGRIVKGGQNSAYISPYSWAAAVEEVIDIDRLIGEGLDDSQQPVPEESLPLIDDRLHEILLGVYSHRVDPIVRILHWPSFLKRCREFRQRKNARGQATSIPSFNTSYPTGSSYNSQQSVPFGNTTALPSNPAPIQDGAPASRTDATFTTLLYAVYSASLVSIIQGPNPPDLGQNVSAATLWTTFKREVATRICKLDGKLARSESIEMLQAMILYMSVELGTSDCQLQWLQLGTAIRMARASGLHRDPLDFGFGPIEIEIRRRIWALLCILDTHLAEQLCREPTITPYSYDTILPLSLNDQELDDLDRLAMAAGQGHINTFTTVEDVEQSQQHLAPVSSMSIVLVEAEMTRQQQQLLCFRYQPRDRPPARASTSPHMSKRANPYSGRAGRTSWVAELQERYKLRYQWETLDTSDPIQCLVSEMCQINILKAAFISRLAQRKEAPGNASTSSGHSEAISIFHDAIQLAVRCVALNQQFSTSPYHWMTRRIREANSCSYLALVLASDLPIGHEATNTAWTILDQLFVSDSNGQILEAGLRSSLIGKVLTKARVRRALQTSLPIAQPYRGHAVEAGTGNYPIHLAQYPPSSLSSNMDTATTFQPCGNIFEDWGTLMQENIGTGGVSSADQSYWPSRVPLAYTQLTPTTQNQSQPYKQTYSRLPVRSNISQSYHLDPNLTTPTRTTEAFPSSHLIHAQSANASPLPSPTIHVHTYSREINADPAPDLQQITSSETWPVQPGNHLQVPRGNSRGAGRERSISQPPARGLTKITSVEPPRRRLTSDFDERASNAVAQWFA